MEKKMQIRNSTIDFLVFTKQNSQDSIEVRVQDENVWLTQDGIAKLFDKGRSTITEHLTEIFASNELSEDSVCRKFRLTASDGKTYNTKFYNLDAIISVGYRVNSLRATQFRQWANVQNKLHWAIHKHTAAELIVERADAEKLHMRLTNWRKAPDGKIEKSDVSIAKNYLSKEELEKLERFVTMYLDYAEFQAKKRIPMTMEDWATRLNKFLDFNEMEILQDKGRVSAEIAKSFAESEFEKYRVIQDRLFESDFDLFLKDAKKLENREQ